MNRAWALVGGVSMAVVLAAGSLGTGSAGAASQEGPPGPADRSSQRMTVEVLNPLAGESPLAETLAGIFTEHLGRNVYGGAWAQVLYNPVMAPRSLFGRDRDNPVGVPGRPAFEMWQGLVKSLGKDLDARVPYGWLPLGAASRSSLEPLGDSGRGFQVRISSNKGSSAAGMMTPAYFPSHRVNRFRIVYRGAADKGDLKLTAALYPISESGCDLSAPLSEAVGLKLQTGEDQESWFEIKKPDFPESRLAVLAVQVQGTGTALLERFEVYPEDALDGWDPEVVSLWKAAGVRLIRFPGGNFVSGYHWRDGIGPRSSRPVLANPAWSVCEFNLVGTDEWMRFCELVGAKALICINAGNGSPKEAAEWVEYCNGNASTPMGRLRAKNGRVQPYSVYLWEVGNELYGSWQIGHATADEYAKRYDRFSQAMRGTDASIRLLANGDTPQWDRTLVKECREPFDTVTIHRLIGQIGNAQVASEQAYLAAAANPVYFERQLAREIRAILQTRIQNPHLALTEFMIHEGRPGYPSNHNISEAVYYSGMMNAAIRSAGFIDIVTHTALINHGGGMIKDRGRVFIDPVYEAIRMYAQLVGGQRVDLKIGSPVSDSPAAVRMPPVTDVPQLDAVAAVSTDQKRMDLILLNRSIDRPSPVSVVLGRWADRVTQVQAQVLTAGNFLDRNSWDEPGRIKTQESKVAMGPGELMLELPKHSLTALRIVF